MSSATRYKRILLIVLSILALCLSQPTRVFAADNTETADFLVIIPDVLDNASKNTLHSVLAELTCLQKTADVQSCEEAKTSLSSYSDIILITPVEDELPDALADGSWEKKQDHQLMVIGRMPDAIAAAFGLETKQISDGGISGTASCTFAANQIVQQSISLTTPVYCPGAEETNGSIDLGEITLPLCSFYSNKRLAYICLDDCASNFGRMLLADQITDWQWPYENAPNQYTGYIVLTDIYPFTDPERLLTYVQYLIDNNAAFVLDVMPLYEHANYPAYTQLCEVLRYAQSEGGAVILHAPVVQNGLESDELMENVTEAFTSLTDQGVYPLALDVPESWILKPEAGDLLRSFRTLFITEDGTFDTLIGSDTKALSSFIRNGNQLVFPSLTANDSGLTYVDCYATAMRISIDDSEEEIHSFIDIAVNSDIPMQSLWNISMALYLNDGIYATYDGSTLIVNGEKKLLNYTPSETNGDFDYQRTIYYRAIANLKGTNRILITISLIVIILFCVLIIRSRRQMHRIFLEKNFIRYNDEPTETDPTPDVPNAENNEKSERKEN